MGDNRPLSGKSRRRFAGAPRRSRSVDKPRGPNWMEALYVRDVSMPQEQVTKTVESQGEATPVKHEAKPAEQEPTLMEKPSDAANRTDDAFGFATLPDNQGAEKPKLEPTKTEEGRGAECSAAESAPVPISDPLKLAEPADVSPPTSQETSPEIPAREQKTKPVSKPKPAITINTGAGPSGVGAKRPPPTPVSPATFSWNDILRVQNLIERCLQQYLTKNEILVTLKQQANVDPAFSNVVWQKLEEQNPTFFRAYSLQLQLKEQIIAFNYLVGQQKEMADKGGKRFLHYGGIARAAAARVPTSLVPTSSVTTPTTTLPPISMDARTFLRTPIRSAKQQRTPAGRRAFNQQVNTYQLGAASSGMSLPPPSPLPLPSPIKTDLDTHAFFT